MRWASLHECAIECAKVEVSRPTSIAEYGLRVIRSFYLLWLSMLGLGMCARWYLDQFIMEFDSGESAGQQARRMGEGQAWGTCTIPLAARCPAMGSSAGLPVLSCAIVRVQVRNVLSHRIISTVVLLIIFFILRYLFCLAPVADGESDIGIPRIA